MMKMYKQGVNIRESEFNRLKNIAINAAASKTPIIFLPCHKSHVDYIVISYALYRMGIAIPHIACGDNLNLPGVGTMLKHGGAYFIKRQWGDDPIYSSMMKEYILVIYITIKKIIK